MISDDLRKRRDNSIRSRHLHVRSGTRPQKSIPRTRRADGRGTIFDDTTAKWGIHPTALLQHPTSDVLKSARSDDCSDVHSLIP